MTLKVALMAVLVEQQNSPLFWVLLAAFAAGIVAAIAWFYDMSPWPGVAASLLFNVWNAARFSREAVPSTGGDDRR